MALPPEPRRTEAEELATIYHEAFVVLGVKTVAEILDLWGDVPSSPSQAARVAASAVQKMLKVLGLRREHARRIAMSFYRLNRALWTGYTIQDLEGEPGDEISLNELRQDFYRVVEALTPEAIGDRPRSSGNATVEIEVIKGLPKILDDLEEHLAEVVEENLAASTGKYVRDLPTPTLQRPSADVDQERDELQTKTGRKVAAIGQRSVQDGARRAVHEIVKVDKRVIGFVRVSRTGTPCGWCAMLISRTLILKEDGGYDNKYTYLSAMSAQLRTDGEEYHTNCQCYAVPIYSVEQYENDSMFDLNRKYDDLWPKVTKGKRGRAALTAWRKYFRENPDQVAGPQAGRPD